MTVPRVFDSTTQQTMEWLKVLCKEEGITDERLAYAALRAALHQLCDRLTVDEAAHLGAQLPLLVRGIYYEGWKPAATPEKVDREEFLEGMRNKLRDHQPIDPEIAARAVFGLLSSNISHGEIEDVVGMLPMDLQPLWRAEARTSAG